MSLTKRFCILALAIFSVTALPSQFPKKSAGKRIVLTNDDGWAEANVRATRNSLVKAGYDVILSCPAVDKSGTGSSTAEPTPVTNGCEFNSCPPNSPAIGTNASDTRLNYVNAFPVDSVRFGIQTLAPKFFNSPPDFVVSGPNVGSNLGSTVQISGTVGAASEASKEGIPSVGFSAPSPPTAHTSYTTLDSDPNATADKAALIYAGLNTKFTDAILAKPKPILPANISINVNYPSTDGCATVDSFKFVLSRILAGNGTTDVETCGTDHLPTESDVVATSGCFVSVSVFSAPTKSDVDASTQKFVLDRLGSDFFSCLD